MCGITHYNYKQNEVGPAFEDVIDALERVIIEGIDIDSVIIAGDLNVDLNRKNAHSDYMLNFADRNQLKFAKLHRNAEYEHTYSALTGQRETRSCIDHFVLSGDLYNAVVRVTCVDSEEGNGGNMLSSDSVLNPSKHNMLKLVLPTQVKRLQSNVTQVKHSRIAWYKINETIKIGTEVNCQSVSKSS